MYREPKDYSFSERLGTGERYEDVIDRYFALAHDIQRPTREENLRGIDRWYVARATPLIRFSVQYKADEQWHETGNIALEIVSDVGAGKPGWVLSSVAKAMVYFCASTHRMLGLRLPLIREWIEGQALMAGHRFRDTTSNGGKWTTRNMICKPSSLPIGAIWWDSAGRGTEQSLPIVED